MLSTVCHYNTLPSENKHLRNVAKYMMWYINTKIFDWIKNNQEYKTQTNSKKLDYIKC